VDSLTPIRPTGERIRVWREVSGREVGFINLDLATEYDRLVAVLRYPARRDQMHFSRQRAAPHSMRNTRAKRYTLDGNVRATPGLLTALVAWNRHPPLCTWAPWAFTATAGPAPPDPRGLPDGEGAADGELEREILHPV
jgi:UDP-sulfoquinovose synthase